MSVIPVGADGAIDITNQSAAPENVVADTVGCFTSSPTSGLGQKYHPMDSTHLIDTRMSGGAATSAHPFAYNETSMSAVNPTLVLNVTATGESGSGFLTVDPVSSTTPTATSTINYVAGTDVANLDLAGTWSSNALTMFVTGAGTRLVIDANGYFADY